MKANLLALLMMLSLVGYGQNPVRGRVTDENDQPLPGVNVLIKGSTLGTVTDAGGEFRIDNAPANAVLLVSFIGYSSQEVTVGTQTNVTVKLMPDLTSLDEVVVVGYGTTTQKELTGSVSVVNGKDLLALNPPRIENALQGQVAGVYISSASGSPGGQLNIRIRGLSTNGDNAPLVLVDGVPYGVEGLAALNPADVESVNVLKDATAGIYGVRAANGVIIITTKQGKRNSKPSLEFGGYYGVQQTGKEIDLLNAHEFAILKNEMIGGSGGPVPFPNPNVGKGTDWQKEVFQTAPIQNYNLNLTGGGEKSSYSIGGSYFDQQGIVGGDKSAYRRYNARFNYTVDIARNVTLQSVLLYTNERRNILPESTISSVLYNALNANPAAPTHKADGSYSFLEDVSDVINPLAQIANTYNRAQVNKLVGKQEITYKINNDFELNGRAGYNYGIVDERQFNPLVWYGVSKAMNTAANENLDPPLATVGGVQVPKYASVRQVQNTYLNYTFEAFLNYNHTFRDIHKVKGTLGTSIQSDIQKGFGGTGFGVKYNSLDFADLSAIDNADWQNNVEGSQSRSRLLSYFLRGEYAYGSKLLVSAIIRRDASSRFGPNNRFGYFPSVSAAWVASEEPFFNKDFVQFLKVRASFGVSGNDRIGDFAYRALLDGEGIYPYNDQLITGTAIGALGNPDLKWETTEQANIGLDLGLFNDKVNISADYYIKTTRDLLFQPDVSAIVGGYGAGGRMPYVNGGDVRNRGIEFKIDYGTAITPDLRMNISYNITTIHNEVLALPPGVDFYKRGSFSVGGSSISRMQVGYPMGAFFGFETDGIYQTQEEVNAAGIQPNAKPGDFRYVDRDGVKGINFGDDSDRTMIGSPIPDVLMGMNIGFNFKGIDLSTTLYASLGNDIVRNYERQVPMSNALRYNIGRWTGPGSTNEYPRLTTDLNDNFAFSNFYVEDGSFLRMKNVQLGYTLPATVIDKIGATRLRVYISANNLFTLTKYKGYDPDFSTRDPLLSGVDQGFYPQPKTFMAGLNLNF